MCICVYAYMCIYVYMYICICVYAHIYVYIYIHIYIYIYIDICIEREREICQHKEAAPSATLVQLDCAQSSNSRSLMSRSFSLSICHVYMSIRIFCVVSCLYIFSMYYHVYMSWCFRYLFNFLAWLILIVQPPIRPILLSSSYNTSIHVNFQVSFFQIRCTARSSWTGRRPRDLSRYNTSI